jgi:hypothetical protein
VQVNDLEHDLIENSLQHPDALDLCELQEAVEIINSAYPEEIVRYYSPSYSKQLLDKLDAAANA